MDFIYYQEGIISRSLISNGIMYRQPCRDTENKKEQFTYRVRKIIFKQREKDETVYIPFTL